MSHNFSTHKLIFLGIPILIIVLVLMGAVFLVLNKNSASSKSTTSPQPPTATSSAKTQTATSSATENQTQSTTPTTTQTTTTTNSTTQQTSPTNIQTPTTPTQPALTVPTSATITYSNSGFDPSLITIASGGKLTIQNNSNIVLDFASDPHPQHTCNPQLNAGNINPGSSKTITLTTVITCGVHNHLRPGDKSTVAVK